MYAKAKLTHEQNSAMEVARIALMNDAPFFAHYYYSELQEHPTLDIETAATDGRRVFYNPEYLLSLKIPERTFVLAHETYHAVSSHPQRMKSYGSAGNLRGIPWSGELFNYCADYIINADLVKNNVGMCNPAWLYNPKISPDELVEDLYEKNKDRIKQGGGGGGGGRPSSTYGQSSGFKGGKPDPRSKDGSFDEILPPEVDPVTGHEDIPDPSEFREAIARAAAAAKAVGKMPGSFQRLVDQILEPQVSWRDHIRMLITGKIGSRHETWDRPNRRRLVLNPIVIMPGRRGYGASDVAVAIDTSGSIGEDELEVFFAEVGGILADVKPKRVHLIWCDATVQRVDEAGSLDELAEIRVRGAPGGGGTSFIPPFEWLEENQIRPEALVYLTDGYGYFPDEAPHYPVVWAMITDVVAPFGETVRVKVGEK